MKSRSNQKNIGYKPKKGAKIEQPVCRFCGRDSVPPNYFEYHRTRKCLVGPNKYERKCWMCGLWFFNMKRVMKRVNMGIQGNIKNGKAGLHDFQPVWMWKHWRPEQIIRHKKYHYEMGHTYGDFNGKRKRISYESGKNHKLWRAKRALRAYQEQNPPGE